MCLDQLAFSEAIMITTEISFQGSERGLEENWLILQANQTFKFTVQFAYKLNCEHKGLCLPYFHFCMNLEVLQT